MVKENRLKFLIFLLIFSYEVLSSNLERKLKSDENLGIFIVAHEDFIPKVRNKALYKIITDDENSLKHSYSLGIIQTKENNELYPKRESYAECSKIYYLYNNYYDKLPEYVGVAQYRKYFDFFDSIDHIENNFKQYDIMVPYPQELDDSIYEEFKSYGLDLVLEELMEIIKDKFPNIYSYANEALSKHSMYRGNIFILSKKDFYEYSNFIFTVLKEFDKTNNLQTDEDIKIYIQQNWKVYFENEEANRKFPKRFHSFLAEGLANIYIYVKFYPKGVLLTVFDYEDVEWQLVNRKSAFYRVMVIILKILTSIVILDIILILVFKWLTRGQNISLRREIRKIKYRIKYALFGGDANITYINSIDEDYKSIKSWNGFTDTQEETGLTEENKLEMSVPKNKEEEKEVKIEERREN